jgi:hypothetical protein
VEGSEVAGAGVEGGETAGAVVQGSEKLPDDLQSQAVGNFRLFIF